MPHRRAPAYVHGGVGILVEPALSESRMREIRPSGSNERGVETERGL
jgi:hypothetical protein